MLLIKQRKEFSFTGRQDQSVERLQFLVCQGEPNDVASTCGPIRCQKGQVSPAEMTSS
jgi:hypothetical protein